MPDPIIPSSATGESPIDPLRAAGTIERVTPVTTTTFSNATDGAGLPLGELLRVLREDLHLRFIVVRDELKVVEDRNVSTIKSSTALFAKIQQHCRVIWRRGDRCVTKEEFFEALRQQSERFESIETHPHEPPVPGVFYALQEELRPATGQALLEFLRFFQPAAPEDRVGLEAFALTLFWGGGSGSRPVFLFTNNDSPSLPAARDTGRGIGKSSTVAAIADLCGGYIEMDQVKDSTKLVTRLLSRGADGKRVVRVDNVKAATLSSAGLERLITTPVISGHQMFVGEGARRNYLTFAITMNGAAVSEDLASRSFVIRLARPVPDPTWFPRLRTFMETRRSEIIADILDRLRQPPAALRNAGRFAEWETAILGRIPGGQNTLDAQRSRRVDVDGDAAEVQELCDSMRQIPHIGDSGIDNRTMRELVEEVTGNRFGKTKVWQYLKRIQVPGLTRRSTSTGIRYVWRDPALACQPAAQPPGTGGPSNSTPPLPAR